MNELIDQAEEWIAGDPDPETAAALREIVDKEDAAGLERAMGATLEFGTAGLRGVVGPGSNQMNRAMVIKTTRGLADYILAKYGGPPETPVVVGYDARPTSRIFASDTIGVLVAAGIRVNYFPEVAPTPLVAFAAKKANAAAAVVVTASHNPPADNGYKVYDSNAAQIIPPTDAAIATAISRTQRANEILRIDDPFHVDHNLIDVVSPSLVDSYWEEVSLYREAKPTSTVKITYTPLHGVGGKTVENIFGRTIHSDFTVVEAQFSPDGTFPTVAFPNPEEPGALDLAMKTASQIDADLILGNDPDADRLAAAVPGRDGWRLLTGNELGVILGSHLLQNHTMTGTPITANSIVSSPMLSEISFSHGATHLTTLTGFKWIVNAALAVEERGEGEFLFGYEEALGYSVGRTVRDKDGISAAVLLADIVALEAEKGRSVLDLLVDLWDEYGLWVSTQKSLVRPGKEGQQEILAAVDHFASNPPSAVGGHPVVGMTDFRLDADIRPPWLGAQALIALDLGEKGRILTRPSGTEPKLKIYVDLRSKELGADPHSQRESLLGEAEKLAAEAAVLLGGG